VLLGGCASVGSVSVSCLGGGHFWTDSGPHAVAAIVTYAGRLKAIATSVICARLAQSAVADDGKAHPPLPGGERRLDGGRRLAIRRL